MYERRIHVAESYRIIIDHTTELLDHDGPDIYRILAHLSSAHIFYGRNTIFAPMLGKWYAIRISIKC